MKTLKILGIRQAKAHLSELVRNAAQGACSIVTDNRKPVAMIGPLPKTPLESENSPQPSAKSRPLSDAAAFRRALLAARRPIDLDF